MPKLKRTSKVAIFSHFSPFPPPSPLFVSATLRPSGMGRLGCHGDTPCRVVRLAGVCGVVLDEVCLVSSGTKRRRRREEEGGGHSSFMQCKCGTFELRTPNQHGGSRKRQHGCAQNDNGSWRRTKRLLISSPVHFLTVVNEKRELQQEAEVGVVFVCQAGLGLAF